MSIATVSISGDLVEKLAAISAAGFDPASFVAAGLLHLSRIWHTDGFATLVMCSFLIILNTSP